MRALDPGGFGLAPATLALEITETELLDDAVASAARFGELRALGIRRARRLRDRLLLAQLPPLTAARQPQDRQALRRRARGRRPRCQLHRRDRRARPQARARRDRRGHRDARTARRPPTSASSSARATSSAAPRWTDTAASGARRRSPSPAEAGGDPGLSLVVSRPATTGVRGCWHARQTSVRSRSDSASRSAHVSRQRARTWPVGFRRVGYEEEANDREASADAEVWEDSARRRCRTCRVRGRELDGDCPEGGGHHGPLAQNCGGTSRRRASCALTSAISASAASSSGTRRSRAARTVSSRTTKWRARPARTHT